MSKALVEYKRFIAERHANWGVDERRLVRLILDNFGEVEACGSAGGKRGKLIARLIQAAGDKAASDLSIENVDANEGRKFVQTLTRMVIEDFRGFSDPRTLDLNKRYVMVYGPNGTGKSSLCEALEYALLGSIQEATAKRIDLKEYIRNANTKRAKAPKLHGISADGTEIEISADVSAYEFCFIEKNRIDGFARVSAHTPQVQQARLAALFGLEAFNAFVTQFNENLGNYLDCIGTKAKQLEEREKQIAGHRQVIAQIPAREAALTEREAALLKQYPSCASLGDLAMHLQGNDKQAGALQALQNEIARLAALKSIDVPQVDELFTNVDEMRTLIAERRDKRGQLTRYKNEISLKDLYQAVLANQAQSPDHCPACDSVLYQDDRLLVPQNPYVKATTKLQAFNVAIQLETRIGDIKRELDHIWPKLPTLLSSIVITANATAFDRREAAAILEKACGTVTDAKSLETFLEDLAGQRILLQDCCAHVKQFNADIANKKAAITMLQEQSKKTAAHVDEMTAINTLRKEILDNTAVAKAAIVQFGLDNEALIKEAEAEKLIIACHAAYSKAYDGIRNELLSYNRDLPARLAKNLNAQTLAFYNIINRHDHVSDHLVCVTLPKVAGDGIMIEFVEGQPHDALQILSEGHIRCLGLAILLAKIVQDQLPFVIFDDIVNAIDDDHRSGILALLFEAEALRERQLIITTHGEDFIKRLENAVPKTIYKDLVKRIDFLVPTEPKKIEVRPDIPRHYLVLAQQRFDEGQVRDSLSYLRKSFEELLNRLWKKIGNKGLAIQVQVTIRSPGQAPDLRSVADGLSAYLGKKGIDVFQAARPLIDKIRGMENTNPIEWTCLNKGTHEGERREEFDRVVVRDILMTLIALDAELEQKAPSPVKPVQPNNLRIHLGEVADQV